MGCSVKHIQIVCVACSFALPLVFCLGSSKSGHEAYLDPSTTSFFLNTQPHPTDIAVVFPCVPTAARDARFHSISGVREFSSLVPA